MDPGTGDDSGAGMDPREVMRAAAEALARPVPRAAAEARATTGPGTDTNAGAVSPHSFALAHARPRDSFRGCSKITDYEFLGKLGEGTFGEVHRAKWRKNGMLVALKKIIMHNEKDGFPITALREIRLLKLLSHKNIVPLIDMAVEHPNRATDKRKRPIMYMATPYMDHDLSGLLDNPSVTFTEPQIKCYMLQLLEGLRYLHDSNILHRDMKAANLLINNKGILQIADFGLARHYEGPTPKSGDGCGPGMREYTGLVVTRWYRPPELLLHLKRYTPAIDIWGVGCVFGEMLTGKPILAGETDGHQLEMIWDLMGSPNEETMPSWQKLPGAEGLTPRSRPGYLTSKFKQYGHGAMNLLKELLKLDWRTRTNATDALRHSYFAMDPPPANPGDLPTFEESHELDRRKFHDRKGALPPAPKGGTVGMGPDAAGAAGGFNSGDPYANGSGRPGGRYGPMQGQQYRPLPLGAGPAEDRRTAWHRERGLPPRPPPPVDRAPLSRRDDFDDRRPRSRGGGGGVGSGGGGSGGGSGGGGRVPEIDTYIPSYGGRHRDDRPPREERRPVRDGRDAWDDRRHDRDRRTRSRSRSPVRERNRDRDRERERDWDRDTYRR